MTPREGNDGNPIPAPAAGRSRPASVMGARILAILLAVMFLGFGAQQVFAQEGLIYSPCWSKDECLNLNSSPGGGSAITQAGMGDCANNRCFCNNASCYDPHRREATCPAGQGKCYANPPPVPITIAIGGAVTVLDVGDYIARVYNYGVTIAGILAGVMFVVGGFQYLTAGSSGRVSKAKERIRDAIIGLLLVLGAYVILNTINPDVLRLQMPKISLVKKKLFVACQYFDMQRPCGQPFTLVRVQGVPDTAPMQQQYRVATGGAADTGATSTTQCVGKSCSRAGFDDATKRCRIPPNTPTSASVNAPAPSGSAPQCIAQPVPPYQCLPCTPFGGDCRGSGPNADCCSGFCSGGRLRSATGDVGALAGAGGYEGTGSSFFQGHCSNGMDGQRCGVDADCFSHHCANITGSGFGGACVSGLEGSPCNADSNCEGGRVCVTKTGINACVTPGYMSPCENNGDCAGGLTCQGYRCLSTLGQIPCSHDSDCSNLSSRTFEFAGRTYTTPDLTAFGPMKCWTKEENLIADNVYVCKPNKPGAVCHVGEGGTDQCGVCYDGGIYDRSIISPSAGICNSGGPGEGCDNNGDCTRYGRSNAKCSAYPGWVVSDYTCTREGTEGMPCGIFIGTDQLLLPVNTCDSGLECPATVLRCVRTPASVCGGGGT